MFTYKESSPKFISKVLVVENGNNQEEKNQPRKMPNLHKAVIALRALDNPVRHQIIDLLKEEPGLNVTNIYTKISQKQAIASFHLGILRRANVVEAIRNGTTINYSLNHDRLKYINELSKALAENSTEATD